MSGYDFRASPFYKLKSKERLANLLHSTVPALQAVCVSDSNYRTFSKPKRDGTLREISSPVYKLKSIQARIAALLKRIEPPAFLYAPVSGRSYVGNAAQHIGAKSIRLLDLENFFPNCKFEKVYWFFRRYMDCSPDVAYILAKLACLDGKLPQGSPCSPILAYWSYVDMWSAIARLVERGGCRLTVYADDITISGDTIPERMIWEVKQEIRKHGHTVAKSKERSRRCRAAEVTGVIVNEGRLTAPNRQRQGLLKTRREMSLASDPQQVRKLRAQLRGRMAQFKQIDAGNLAVKGNEPPPPRP